MKKRLFAVATGTLVACSLAVFSVAADAAAESAGKEKKPKPPTYGANCPGACAFQVKSQDKAEVTAAVKEHAKAKHQKEMSDQEVDAMVKESKS